MEFEEAEAETIQLFGEDLDHAKRAEQRSDYDFCPKCGSPTIEPDGKEFTSLRCSKCDWVIGITVREITSKEERDAVAESGAAE